jgi:hypothetical protein
VEVVAEQRQHQVYLEEMVEMVFLVAVVVLV